MRIAQVAPIFYTVPPVDYGGIERIVSLITEGLVERGHEVTLFAAGDSRTKARLVSPIAKAPVPGSLMCIDDEYFHATKVYMDYLEKSEFDIIHDHSWYGPVYGSMLSRYLRIVTTLHEHWSPGNRRLHKLLGNRISRVAISKSQQLLNTEVEYAGLIHNALELKDYPYRDQKEDFLIFVGRVNPTKGVEIAVKIAKRCGLHLKMVIRKHDDFEKKYWAENVVPHLSGDEEVLENTRHKVKVELLGRARACLFPIQWEEPFGLVMIEAMACGTPVIAMSRGAAPEVIGEGITGYLCEDEDQMVEAVGKVKEVSPEQCRHRVKERFSASSMVAKYERLFEKLLAGR
jgi:glycosyltransferase involved in cell wall biosynthesis